jgi:Protein of unknown function DUF262/HNH endonuclease
MLQNTKQSNHLSENTDLEEDYYSSEENADDGELIKGKVFIEKKDLPIREYKTMFEEGDLILQPDYQRKYVVDIKFASRLIESIILDVPIPAVFLAEEQDGKFSVIDGQQRLTSFIHFLLGYLPDDKKTVFKLTGTKQLSVEQGRGKTYAQIDDLAVKNKIKTTSIQAIIIKNSSHEDLKFAIFERLNTGSVKLNEDELRNSIYRGNYINLLDRLDEEPDFHALVRNENWKKRMIYRGMILRFLSLSEKSYINYKASMKQFCNKELRENRNLDAKKAKDYEQRFKKCLDLVKIVFGDKAFRRFLVGTPKEPNGKWTTTKINMALYDIQMCGFLDYQKSQIVPKADEIREAMINLMCNNQDFINSIELKTNDTGTLKSRFEIWYSVLKKIIGNKINNSRNFTYEQKETLFKQSKAKCAICGQKILQIEDSEVDHIKPHSKGGETILSNAQITHRYCNRAKGNRTSNVSSSLF